LPKKTKETAFSSREATKEEKEERARLWSHPRSSCDEKAVVTEGKEALWFPRSFTKIAERVGKRS